ncbi:MAG: helix-turn-helix transcriptional regulator [Prochloraceae cyanobacterium]|nr:helix-turn-helix transcriptional regulator [Prochloraceae cyanobacterium]
MLHKYFKQTMDRFGIKGSELAESFGCSRNHISEIRTGKCSPSISRFWELIETMEELAPGAKRYFATLLAGCDLESVDLQALVENMDNNQLSAILFVIAEAMKDNCENTRIVTPQRDLIAS